MIEELLRYQEVDADLRKVETTLSQSQERKKAVAAKKYLDGVEESLDKLNFKAAELLATYKNVGEELDKVKELKTEFLNATTVIEGENEAGYLIKKTDELLVEIKNLSLTAEKIFDEMQKVLKEYAMLKTKTKIAQTQYSENAVKYNELKNSVQSEKNAIEQELAKLKKAVSPELMNRYLEKRANKIYPVLYEINNGACGACNMQLSMNEINKLKNGEIVECDHCGRLLFGKDK